MTDRTAARRAGRYEARMRAGGLVKKHLWVPRERADEIERIAADMRRAREGEGGGDPLGRVLARLRAHEAELRRRGVRHVGVFGSVAWGEDRPDSDLDVLVTLDPDAGLGLIEYAGIRRYLEEITGRRVDLANRATLKAYVRPEAEADLVLAF